MVHPDEYELSAFLAGDLPATRAERVAIHLDECSQCREMAERLTAVPGELSASLLVASGSKPSGDDFPSLPQISGYTELRELGRGGCGVVYRAYDLSADRLVAIKFLRSGALASQAERAWFLAEAGAAATLCHPNIVEVFAVGGVHAVPYYVMECALGGSLAGKLDGTPVAPRTAVRLIQTVAAAVHTAHLAGIVHRDLKPGNILLTDEPDPFATPKVSDFGLAKSDDVSQPPTSTLAILGTPSYMAPEQAFGRSKRVGPAADVYSLGAILYEMLTGRPPFKGATPYETLLQVRTFDLVWPRRLRPDLRASLEAICLKCLEQHPQHRYPTAAALADDLGRFSTGAAVHARLPSSRRRLQRWAKANPSTAKMSFALVAGLTGSIIALSALWLHAEEKRREASRSAEVALQSRIAARKSLGLYAESAKRLFRGPESISEDEKGEFVRAVEMAVGVLSPPTGDPAEEHAAAYALLKFADCLRALRELEAATELCRKGIEALGRLSSENPDRLRIAFDYSQGCSQLFSLLQKTERIDEAESYIREAIRVGEIVRSRNPESDECRGALANYRAQLARILIDRGDFAAADHLVESAIEESRSLCDKYPDDPFRWAAAHAHHQMKADLLFARDRSIEGFVGQARFGLSMSAWNRDNIRRNDWGGVLIAVTNTIQVTAALAHFGRAEEAEELAGISLAAAEEYVRAAPEDIRTRFILADRLSENARLRFNRKPEESSKLSLAAVIAYEDVIRSNPTHAGLAGTRLALLLATSPDSRIRNPARASELIGRESPQKVHGIAHYANNEYEKSRKVLAVPTKAEDARGTSDISRRAYLALTLHRLGEGLAARAELDSLTDDLRGGNNLRWEELSDWAEAWKVVHRTEPPVLWRKR